MKKLLFVLLLSISSVVHAQWVLISSFDEGKIYIDTTNIVQTDKFKRMWVRYEHEINAPIY